MIMISSEYKQECNRADFRTVFRFHCHQWTCRVILFFAIRDNGFFLAKSCKVVFFGNLISECLYLTKRVSRVRNTSAVVGVAVFEITCTFFLLLRVGEVVCTTVLFCLFVCLLKYFTRHQNSSHCTSQKPQDRHVIRNSTKHTYIHTYIDDCWNNPVSTVVVQLGRPVF